ncbi:MAG: lysylphosphatidylglycerol synthase domain-containing protein [Noviherbaspirillum sp.]
MTGPRSARPAARAGWRSRPWWPWARRALNLLFLAVVAYLLVSLAKNVEWEEVLASIRRLPSILLAAAALLAMGSYVLYSCFDLLGRHMTGHRLGTGEVMTINFISYAFNINLGSLIGGVAFRFRLYSRHGLDNETITRVVAMSILTNWLGYLAVAGLVFALAPFPLPEEWKLDAGGLRWLGWLLCAIALAYLFLCARSRRRTWTLRGHELHLPSLRLALLQFAMSSLNWLLIAGIIYLLLDRKIPYPAILGVYLVAAIAGVITHIPAGLGVLEATFVALLSHRLASSELLAGLLAFRAIYYLVPLVAGTIVYLLLEVRAKKLANSSP